MFARYARYSISYIFTSFAAQKNLFFSPFIHYWATFVAQMFKKTYKTPKNLQKNA